MYDSDIKFRNLLIIKPSSLGDIVHALPFLGMIKQRFPQAKITWIVKERWADILSGNRFIDELIYFPVSFKELCKFINHIRKLKFDLVIDLQCLLRSGLITFLTGSKTRIGFANGREMSPLFYNHKIPVKDTNIHAIDRYSLIAEYLGADISKKEFDFFVKKEDEEYISDIFYKNQITNFNKVIVINPFARWETKRWPMERFAKISDLLLKVDGIKVIFIGDKNDKKEIGDNIPYTTIKPINLVGEISLKQLIALLKRADTLLTNDSGTMHIAAALNTKVVALFGPTDPIKTGPYGKGHKVLRDTNLNCIPCFKKNCSNDHACMKAITVEAVAQILLK